MSGIRCRKAWIIRKGSADLKIKYNNDRIYAVPGQVAAKSNVSGVRLCIRVYVYAADGSGEQDFIYGEAVV